MTPTYTDESIHPAALLSAPHPPPAWFVHTPHPDHPKETPGLSTHDYQLAKITWQELDNRTRFWQWREYFAQVISDSQLLEKEVNPEPTTSHSDIIDPLNQQAP